MTKTLWALICTWAKHLDTGSPLIFNFWPWIVKENFSADNKKQLLRTLSAWPSPLDILKGSNHAALCSVVRSIAGLQSGLDIAASLIKSCGLGVLKHHATSFEIGKLLPGRYFSNIFPQTTEERFLLKLNGSSWDPAKPQRLTLFSVVHLSPHAALGYPKWSRSYQQPPREGLFQGTRAHCWPLSWECGARSDPPRTVVPLAFVPMWPYLGQLAPYQWLAPRLPPLISGQTRFQAWDSRPDLGAEGGSLMLTNYKIALGPFWANTFRQGEGSSHGWNSQGS